MYTSTKKLLSTRDIVGYTLPRLHKGKSCYVDFWAYDPLTEGLKRKKYMLDHLKKGEREKIATVLITKISNLLMAGWNPFVNNETSRSFAEWGVSGNLVGISINLCKSIQKELFINDTP